MESKVSYTLVGAFVLILAAATLTVALWLAAGTEQKTYDRYVAYVYESVSGLNVRAPVKYRGVGVGQVYSISLDRENPERVRLILEIEQGTPIKQDTVATIATQGITGIGFLELTGGAANSPPLEAKPDQQYPEIRTGPSLFVRLDTAVSTMLKEMTDVAQDLSTVATRTSRLLDDEKQESIAKTLANVERLTSTLAARTEDIAGNAAHLNAILENTAAATNDLPQVVNKVNTLLTSVDAAVATIDKTASDLSAVAKRSEQQLGKSSTELLAEVNPVLAEMRELGEALRRVAQEVERRPESLIFGRNRNQLGPGEQESTE